MNKESIKKIKKFAETRTTVSVIFAVIALVVGFYFVFRTPLFWGEDETSQFARAYQISEGHIFSQKLYNVQPRGGGYGGKIPSGVQNLITAVDKNLLSTGYVSKTNIAQYQQLASKPINSKTAVEYSFPNTSAYSPIAYLPSALALKIATGLNLSIGTSIYLSRIFELLAYVAIIYLALRVLRKSRIKWLFFVVALIPTAIAQASVITADTLTNAIIILFSALIIKGWLKQKFTRFEIVELILASILLPLLKPTYVVLDLLVLFIPSGLISAKLSLSRSIKWLSILGAVLAFGLWSLATSKLANFQSIIIPGNIWLLIHPHAQIKLLMHKPFTFVKAYIRTLLLVDTALFIQMFGAFGFNGFVFPGVSLVLYLVALFASVGFIEKIRLSITNNIATIVVILGGITAIFLTEYVTASPVGSTVIDSLEGRYFIPYILLFVVWLAANISPRFALNKTSSKKFKIMLVCLVVFGLLFTCIKYQYLTYHQIMLPS